MSKNFQMLQLFCAPIQKGQERVFMCGWLGVCALQKEGHSGIKAGHSVFSTCKRYRGRRSPHTDLQVEDFMVQWGTCCIAFRGKKKRNKSTVGASTCPDASGPSQLSHLLMMASCCTHWCSRDSSPIQEGMLQTCLSCSLGICAVQWVVQAKLIPKAVLPSVYYKKAVRSAFLKWGTKMSVFVLFPFE